MLVKTTHERHLFGCIAAATALGLSAWAADAPNTLSGSATQPAQVGLTNEQVIADFHARQQELKLKMPDPGVLSDPARRAATAPEAIPLLNEVADDLRALASRNLESKPKLQSQLREINIYRAALGDPKANAELGAAASSADPAIALEAQADQLSMRWDLAGKAPDAQDAIITDLQKLDKTHADNRELTMLTYRMYESVPGTDQATRLRSLITNDLQNPLATKMAQSFEGAAQLAANIGKPMVISGTTVDGKSLSTADWKGKVILVDFWASWCGPCKAELPHVKAVYQKYHAQGLEILGVSNDYKKEALVSYLAGDRELAWPNLFDPTAASNDQWHPITLKYGIEAIPEMLLIDKSGVLRTTDALKNMDEMIPKLLAENASAATN